MTYEPLNDTMAADPGLSAGTTNDGEFLSREEQLLFRTITTLLGWTEQWNKHTAQARPPLLTKDTKGKVKKRAFGLLSTLANILVRHKEVLAIVPSSLKTRTTQTISIVLEPNNRADELSRRYLATINPERFVQNEHALTQTY
jgi:hypothetical protein